jgi:TolB-like protein/DNA-binding SARP family transcriptional activator/Flp pilus assembly protein TadD
MNSTPTFRLRLFGTPSLEGEDGVAITGRVVQRHRVALLALLAMSSDRRSTRDKLMARLWPERDQDRARSLLNTAVYVLRSSLGETAIVSAGDELRLDDAVVSCDVADFEGALGRDEHARALALYRGPFLDGFFLGDAPDFEQWLSRERERLAGAYHKALEALAEAAEARFDFSAATELWKSRAVQDPYDSRVALRLMHAMEASRNRAGALQYAAVHQRLLQDEFGITATPEIATLVEHLRTMRASEPVTHAPPASHAAVPSPEPVEVRPAPPSPPQAGARETPRRRTRRFGRGAAALATAAIALIAWRFWPAGARPEGSIAVLPFANLAAGGDSNYFSEGLTEEIIAALSAVPDLKVISRTSAMYYKGSTKPLRQIGEELKVAHILEGSVRQSGGRVRITAQLIDARSEEHLWVRTFDDDLRDIFRVQEQIAREVARALQLELGESGRRGLASRGTRDPEAYELYRRGRYFWSLRTRDGLERAAEYFNRAIARDSTYADAYAALADNYLTSWQLGVASLPPAELYTRARWAAERAVALDENSADAHTAISHTLLWQRNWPGAEREFRWAIQLNPGNASARTWLSLVLSGMGKGDEALDQSRRASELDPFAVIPTGTYGWQCYLSRDTECAIDQFRRRIEIAPTWGLGHNSLAMALAQKGMLAEALASVRTSIQLSPERPDFVADLAWIQALMGQTTAARATLRRAKATPFEPYNIGRAYVALGEPDSAFAWLERATWNFPHRADRRDPALDGVRSDARFARLVSRIDREMGLRGTH